jgi:hypothetical protein
VPQPARISSLAAVPDTFVANHATCWSNPRVWPARRRAHGTHAVTTPWRRQATLGTSDTRKHCRRPQPGSRHFRPLD